MWRPGKYMSWCRAHTKGIPAQGGNWGLVTPGIPSTSDSPRFREAELRAAPRHPLGFPFLVDLFSSPVQLSLLFQAALEDNRAQRCHFSPSRFLSDPSPLLYSISGFLFFKLPCHAMGTLRQLMERQTMARKKGLWQLCE